MRQEGDAEGGAGEGEALRGQGRPVSTRALELETAKEILAEIFGVRSGEVEEMIQRRL